MKRGGLIKRSPLKKFGPRAAEWQKHRSQRVKSDVDEDGLIRCEDYKLGLERCGIARLPESMDLHHGKGRDGKLLTDDRWLVWLTRECHGEAHDNNSSFASSEAENDTERQMEDASSGDEISGLQG